MSGRCAILTGAGSGVGRATAVLLASRGWRLALLGRTRATLMQTEQLCGAGEHVVVEADVGDDAAVHRAVEEANAAFKGRLDALLNVAGVAPRAAVAATDSRMMRSALDVNVVGPAALISASWPRLVASRGAIVNVSSMAAVDPFSGFLAYGASKAALESLTRSVNVEGREAGVRAFTLTLGAVETKMLRGLFGTDDCPPEAALQPEDVAREILECLEGKRDHDKPIFLVPQQPRRPPDVVS
ncbi:hypothetical protein M885DRAFT_543101 [Pelagophyceae sp. CCMP2097]|nr:hypothetical protein M885DRAFT_543101 [Pelagophyceae sp. CCMP2097]